MMELQKKHINSIHHIVETTDDSSIESMLAIIN